MGEKLKKFAKVVVMGSAIGTLSTVLVTQCTGGLELGNDFKKDNTTQSFAESNSITMKEIKATLRMKNVPDEIIREVVNYLLQHNISQTEKERIQEEFLQVLVAGGIIFTCSALFAALDAIYAKRNKKLNHERQM
ncbi:MAG: hypothetical protein LBH47_03730 [Christensenellaceae bacterium]|jgi:preprotein translocase subunit SecF|nr:hypothetical protein [Christensenellaceae bacterium]